MVVKTLGFSYLDIFGAFIWLQRRQHPSGTTLNRPM